MIIAITGGSGNIGKLIVNSFLKRNLKLVCFSKSKIPNYFENVMNITWVKHDFTKGPLKTKRLENFDAVIHLANENNNRLNDIMLNQKMMIHVLKSFKKFSKFIFFSSQMVYGNPNRTNIKENFLLSPNSSFYACSKINCENLLSNYSESKNILSITLRITGICNISKNLIYKIKKKLLKNLPIDIYGNKDLYRDYIFFDDMEKLINLIILKKFKEKKNYIFNFSSFQNQSIYKIISLMKKDLNSKSILKIKKNRVIRNNFSMNINYIKKILNFKPVSLNSNILNFLNEK